MPLVDEIAQAMRDVGNARAAGVARNGAIWGGTLMDMGALASKTAQEMQQAKIQQQEAALRNQQMAASQQQIAASKADVALAQNRDTREGQAFTAQQTANAQAQVAALHARTVQRLGAVRGQPQLWNAIRAGIIADGLAKPEEIPTSYPGDDAIDAELRGLMSAKDQFDIAHPKPTILPADATAIAPNPAGGFSTVATGAPKPSSFEQKPVLIDGKPGLISYDSKSGKSFDAAGNDVTAKIAPIPSAAQVSINAADLTAPALDQAAQKFLETGILPPGFGTAGVIQKTKIMNRAAEIDPQAALARNQAVYKADSTNLTNLQKTEGTLSAFENTAGKNLDQFLSLADKIPDTGVPWLNTPVRLLNQNMVGSANMAAINAARDVAMREIARVTNDPKLSGALTDSARAEVAGLNPQNATLPQIKAVAKVLKQDMANVHKGINEQIAIVKGGIGSNPAGVNAAPAAPAAAPAATTPKDGTEGVINGRAVIWSTIPGKGSGWVPK